MLFSLKGPFGHPKESFKMILGLVLGLFFCYCNCGHHGRTPNAKNAKCNETLSNLCGKWIKRIEPDYVEFEDGEKVDIKNLGYRMIKPLIWW